MGQGGSSNKEEMASLRESASSASLRSLESVKATPNPQEAQRQIQRVRLRIKTFRVRAGTDDICVSLYETWMVEKERVQKTWSELTIPARRALVMTLREKVLLRARILHSVVAPRNTGAYSKSRVVRNLMEKCAFELFDTSVVYGDLPAFVEEVLRKQGGGPEIPIGLLMEVNNAFEPLDHRLSPSPSTHSDASESMYLKFSTTTSSTGTSSAAIPLESSGSSDDSESEDGNSPKTSNSNGPSVMVNSQSVNSLQGYYSNNERHREKRKSTSKSIQKLLSFIPEEGLDTVSRRSLTLELLLEMRNAFLTHFAILVFSELFDDVDKVLYKYEYDSDTDTDVALSDTDCEEVVSDFSEENDF